MTLEYYIFVSNNCNLNCSYCSILVEAKKRHVPEYPQYSIKELFGFIVEQQKNRCDKTVDILFFGGEPTLNFDFIADVIQYSRTINVDYKFNFVLHTNGLLVDKLPNKILYYLSAIILSVNYLEIPKFNLANSYFQKIVDNIKIIKNRKALPIIGRFTITEKSSVYTLVMQLHSFFDYIYWQIENCYSFSDYKNFYQVYSYEISLLLEIWMSYLDRGIKLNLIPFLSCVNFLVNDINQTGFSCGYNESMLYIQTDGLCYSCAEDFLSKKNLIGNLSDGICFDNFSLQNTICNACYYRKICQGRCGRMHREFSSEHINEYCQLNRYHFDFIAEKINEISSLTMRYNYDFDFGKHILTYTEYTP